MRQTLAAVAAAWIAAALAGGQGSPPANQGGSSSSKPELQDVKSDPGPPKAPLSLKGAGPLSPEEAARLAARDLAQAKDKSAAKSKESAPPDQTGGSADSGAVVEFQPAASRSRTAPGAVVDPKRSRVARVHGDVYGAGGSAGHATSESVGTTSRSGKTSVYVQSDQAHSNSSPAQ